jgi:PAS domain S-box-containing protein
MTPSYLGRVTLLIFLYVLTGKLGLLLAVPPGYATVIWPASGIALGMLMIHGPGLWPGVFLGSFLLNAWNSAAFAEPVFSPPMFAALAIATGSTLQALVGRALIARFIGLPLRLTTGRQVARLLVVAAPLTCIVAASVGTGALYGLGVVERADLGANWLAWWSGDTLGVLVFMPLVLLAPAGRDHLRWRDAALGRMPLAALLLLLLPLGLTFYAWKAVTEYDYQRGDAKFAALTIESDKALQNRLASYGSALLGAAGFMQGSAAVSRQEWRTYVETIKVRQNFPGINGLGWIQPVEDADLPEFVARMRADDAPAFTIHPAVAGGPNYIISYLEPRDGNEGALGLNLAFEGQRLAAARLARDSGHAAITGRIVLVQDANRSVGFLMLYPVYQRDMPVDSVEGRRAALRGWTYAPFLATSFLDGLTLSQNSEFRLRIYDGTAANDDALIFSSPAQPAARPAFSKRTILRVQQRHWLLVWESTPGFERNERSTNPLYILIGGILFTALLALLLIVITVRRTDTIEQMVGGRRFAVPLLVFVVIAAASLALYSRLAAHDSGTLPSLVLAAGLLVAALAALSVRYILISRLKSAHLAESLALNAGIISSSAHLVIAIDTQYRIMIFNRAAENALGYRAAEVTGRRAIPIFMDAGELAERARTLSAELGETISVGPEIFTRIPLRDGHETREWTFVRKDGTRFPVSVVITPLRDDAGAVTGFLGVIEDVTARKEVDRMKAEFTAVVSHELRTPLTSIRGSLGLILGALATSLPEKVRDLLEIAQSNCERLVLLVNDILDVEKFSAGQMRFDIQTLSLAAVTLRAVEANEGYARRFNARIGLAPIDESLRVAVDADRFIQVMSNLLSNAAKYSPPGGEIHVWAETTTERGERAVRVFVRDQGAGIPKDFQAHIFEKFSQADSSTTRDKGGTGLGLHIARRFIEHMQGRIGFASEPGSGATFWVELPLAPAVPGS